MKLAIRVFVIQNVVPLRCSLVTAFYLVSLWILTKSDMKRGNRLPLIHEIQAALALDDEDSIRYTFDVFLSEEGYTVTPAASYDEAVSMIRATDFDLMYVDIVMEGKTRSKAMP